MGVIVLPGRSSLPRTTYGLSGMAAKAIRYAFFPVRPGAYDNTWQYAAIPLT